MSRSNLDHDEFCLISMAATTTIHVPSSYLWAPRTFLSASPLIRLRSLSRLFSNAWLAVAKSANWWCLALSKHCKSERLQPGKLPRI